MVPVTHPSFRSNNVLVPAFSSIKIQAPTGGNSAEQQTTVKQKVESQTRISFRRKQLYVWLSLTFGALLLAAALYDLIVTVWIQSSDVLPSGWRSVIMLLHSASFYIFLIGFIYSYEAASTWNIGLSLLSFVVNLVAFVLRVVYELAFIDMHPASFTS
eukprot:EC839115.1.p1 GENE.EC839115.1~~EC839115.1.p1  ORF type:complete len:180 (+),score=23.67 EC839115.1:67-540(+)